MSRQDDAFVHVMDQLRDKQCAIVHRDDLFGDEERALWDEADAFMDGFSDNEATRAFEAGYFDHLQANEALDRREAETLTELKAAADTADGEREAAIKAVQEARAGGVKAEAVKAQDAYKAVYQAHREAASAHHAAIKAFATERKGLNETFKPYVFSHKMFLGRSLQWSDPTVRLSIAPRFLDIADAYYGEPAKLRIPTIWKVSRISPNHAPPPRKGSQLWHRDQTDSHILKLFVYFSDVTAETGALEYVPNSLPTSEPWGRRIPLLETTGYPPQEVVRDLVPVQDIVSCAGKRGSLVFVDTAGLHRGGYAKDGDRVSMQATYLRPAHKDPQPPMIRPDVRPEGLTDRAVFALN